MKIAILAGASALALFAATAAYAADPANTATIDQISVSMGNVDSYGDNNHNTATIDQTAETAQTMSSATINQYDQNNTATVTQGGQANMATVTQDQNTVQGAGNNASVSQLGNTGKVTVYQDGNSFAQVQQTNGSALEAATVYQYGSQPYGVGGVEIMQAGYNEQATAYQNGNNNSSFVTQTGQGGGQNAYNYSYSRFSGEPLPVENGASVTPVYLQAGVLSDQEGNNNYSNVNQAGYSNFVFSGASGSNNNITVTQYSGSNESLATAQTLGNYNTQNVQQNGGTSASTSITNGSNNMVTVSQNGSNASTIGQGFPLGGIGTGPEPGVVGDQATVTQSGNGNTSLINQNGSYETASVTQNGGNDSSTITQGSLTDTAIVYQSGYGDTSTVTQGGNTFGGPLLNYANVSQVQNGAVSTIMQNGYSNAAYVRQ